jgi:hypothetical protein
MSQTVVDNSVKIKSLKLSKLDDSKSPIDITPQVVEFSVYEDIKFPVIRAEFIIADANDIASTFPIICEEKIEVEFYTPGLESASVKYTFNVNSVGSCSYQTQLKGKLYVIEAISQEFATNASKLINEKHKGNISDLISMVCKNHLKTKKQVIINDPTKGNEDTLISRLRPFQAIDFHRKRAVSKKYESSSYVFFENKRGFNFCTIEYLLDSGSSQEKINDKRFVLDTPNNTNVRNLSYRNIIALNNISLADNTTKMTSGSLNMRVKRFDLLTGTVEVSSYVNKEQQSKFKFSSKTATPINTSSFEDRYGKTPAISLLVPYSSEFQENYIGGSLGAKHSYVNKLDQNLFYAHINGDTEITVGDVITIDVPSTDGGTAGGGKDRLLQGNYLISKLRHIVKNLSGLQRSHTMSIELIKGSYEDTI